MSDEQYSSILWPSMQETWLGIWRERDLYSPKHNLALMFEAAAKNETIQSAIIGDNNDIDFKHKDLSMIGRVLPWAVARDILDYETYTGFYWVHAWTETMVLSVRECDGFLDIIPVQRNPPEILPIK